jgi:late competence protein required for DNA uptake (superfamily II DNA/RNA helicase)
MKPMNCKRCDTTIGASPHNFSIKVFYCLMCEQIIKRERMK